MSETPTTNVRKNLVSSGLRVLNRNFKYDLPNRTSERRRTKDLICRFNSDVHQSQRTFATSEGLTTQKFSNTFPEIRKNAKFTQNMQIYAKNGLVNVQYTFTYYTN